MRSVLWIRAGPRPTNVRRSAGGLRPRGLPKLARVHARDGRGLICDNAHPMHATRAVRGRVGARHAPVSYTHLDVYKRQGLRGPAKLLAENAGFVAHAEGVLRLSLPPEQEHLKSPNLVLQLGDALGAQLGGDVQVRFEIGQPRGETANARNLRARDARQPVSYTHLDVYKRQLGHLSGTAHSSGALATPQQGLTNFHAQAATVALRMPQCRHCLLYTSRCV